MEDIDGDLLEHLGLTEKVNSLAPLAAAIAALHEAGVAHRDIKLSNAVRTKDGVRLIDFGRAAPLGLKLAILGGTHGHDMDFREFTFEDVRE